MDTRDTIGNLIKKHGLGMIAWLIITEAILIAAALAAVFSGRFDVALLAFILIEIREINRKID